MVIEEVDESLGWLQTLLDARLADPGELAGLIKESDELTRIFVASRKTAETNLARETHAARAQKRMSRIDRTSGA